MVLCTKGIEHMCKAIQIFNCLMTFEPTVANFKDLLWSSNWDPFLRANLTLLLKVRPNGQLLMADKLPSLVPLCAFAFQIVTNMSP